MQSVNVLYNTFISQRKKERFEFILEPLQALIQLSCLAFCPIGSKITIYNNLLYIQTPGWSQAIIRTYYNDSKDDLYFLFNVINRYNKFYKHLRESTLEEERNLYKLIIELSRKGIDNLIQTYQQSDKPSLLHTLQMYKSMLIKENFDKSFSNSPTPSESGDYSESDERERDRDKYISRSRNRPKNVCMVRDSNNNEIDGEFDTYIESNIESNNEMNNETNIENNIQNNINSENYYNKNEIITTTNDYIPYDDTSIEPGIDNIFIKITQLYSKEDLHVIYNTLLLIRNNSQNFNTYMDGLNNILDPLNNKIKKWINENIVF